MPHNLVYNDRYSARLFDRHRPCDETWKWMRRRPNDANYCLLLRYTTMQRAKYQCSDKYVKCICIFGCNLSFQLRIYKMYEGIFRSIYININYNSCFIYMSICNIFAIQIHLIGKTSHNCARYDNQYFAYKTVDVNASNNYIHTCTYVIILFMT